MIDNAYELFCFAKCINPEYTFIEHDGEGNFKLYKERSSSDYIDLDTRYFNPVIFNNIPVGRRCSLKQVANGYRIGRSDRSHIFSAGIHYSYPYNLIMAVFNPTPEEEFEYSWFEITEDRWRGINYALTTLTKMENLCIYYYFSKEESMTLDAISKKFGRTREGIRQTVHKALRKLRHPSRARYLLYGYAIASGEIKERERALRQKEIDDANKEIDERLDKLRTKLNSTDEELIEYDADIDLYDLDLSVRAYNCLCRAGYKTLGDISKASQYDLMCIRNLGRKSLDEILDKVAKYGIKLEAGV